VAAVLRRLKFALEPRWLALHLFVVASCVTMVLLGRWQLRVSNSRHFSLQNSAYAVQWWAFSIFAVLMWARILRDAMGAAQTALATDLVTGAAAAQPGAEAAHGVAYRRYVMPQSATSPAAAVDAEHAAYNEYLARLAAGDSADPARVQQIQQIQQGRSSG